MEQRHKILLLDDDPELLALYREILSQLPSRPEVSTASNGSRGLAMLESEPFHLLICDLKMPKMDGLQVLSIVRRKHPQLRTVALTAVQDEQFRSRAYALGVDLFWHKPNSEQEIKMFLECLESLLGREKEGGGFRGIQSKSLVDIIQLECISQSSAVLRITNGPLTGRIWIQEGELIDAEGGDLKGEEALKKILAWRAGNFESLAAEPGRPRVIFKSYNALLLESAQAQDEARVGGPNGLNAAEASPISQLSEVEGIEFSLVLKAGQAMPQSVRGLENPERMIAWTRQSLEKFRGLGERLNVGSLEVVEGLGPHRNVSLASQGETELCIGWPPSMTKDQIGERMKEVSALWVS